MSRTAVRSPNGVDAALSLFPALTRSSVESCRLELLRNDMFFSALNSALVEKRHLRTSCDGCYEFLYLVIRFAKPRVVIETGVFDGLSSAVILQALSDNGDGILLSIDVPARGPIVGSTHLMPNASLPVDCGPGWLIPDVLRPRHRLILGDSGALLPELLREYSPVDVFFHDSLHTFAHQTFEYTTVWPRLAEGGLLLSDDVHWSAAFHKFAKKAGRRYLIVDGVGVLRK